MATLVMVIAPERFRVEELFETRAELDAAGHTRRSWPARGQGVCTGSRGGSVRCDVTIDQIDPGRFDGVVFVGGGGSKVLFTEEATLSLAEAMHREGKLVAAICLAPLILANAGALAGRRATVAGTQGAILEDRGATCTGPGVTVDGNVVTANGPKSSRLFGQKINGVLARRHSSPVEAPPHHCAACGRVAAPA